MEPKAAPARFEPARDAALGLALGLYPPVLLDAPAGAAARSLAALALALVLGALASTRRAVAAPAGRANRGALRASAFAAGLLSAAALLPGLAAHGAIFSYGLPAGSVRAVEGVLARDAGLGSGGFRRYELELAASEGAAAPASVAPRADACGTLVILVRNGAPASKGQRLRVAARPDSEPEGGRLLFAERNDVRALGWISESAELRARLLEGFVGALSPLGRRAPGLLSALLTGRRDGLEPGLRDSFAAAGCAHIIALSGEHLAVLASIVAALLGRLLGPRRVRTAAAAFALAYAWLAGGESPILRSALMFAYGALALLADRPQKLGQSLGIAFIVLAARKPENAFTLSFAFTFLALGGIGLLAPAWECLLAPALPARVAKVLATSLAAWTASSALGAAAFGRVPLVGPFVAAPASLLAAALMWCGLAGAAAAALHPALAAPAGALCDLLYDILVGLVGAASRAPAIDLPDPGAKALGIALVATIGALVYALPHARELLHRNRFRRLAELDRAGCAALPDDPGRSRHRLRFALGHLGPAGGGGTGHAKALRPELPRGAARPRARHGGDRPRARRGRVGDRAGHRGDDPPGA
ncbi:MAG: ComEC/Rec2 family competence protein [Spirochaetales bacterium]|nr:ComEC/Rec2 family competence protein [Spirochaetales bacterium]